MNEENNTIKTPLFALAVALAYEINVNKKTSRQEKARLVTLFGKLVEMEVMSEIDLQELTQRAFTYARENDIDDFLKRIVPLLSDTQKLSVLINVCDTMMVDGHITMGEKDLVNKFQKAFNIDDDAMRGIREFLTLKNDTSLFMDEGHPLNVRFFDIKSIFGPG